LQNRYVIGGRPAFESKLAIALLNASGKTAGPVAYKHEGRGKDRTCTATVRDAATRQTISHTLHWATVEAEGWLAKKGSKWGTDPLLMLKYRTAMQLIRTTYPEVLLGMVTVEEATELQESDPLKADSSALYRQHLEADRIADELVARMDADSDATDDKAERRRQLEEFRFTGIGDDVYQEQLERCDSLQELTTIEEWFSGQCQDDLEREWVRDMARNRRDQINTQRSEEAMK
jgi:hypothetical protein